MINYRTTPLLDAQGNPIYCPRTGLQLFGYIIRTPYGETLVEKSVRAAIIAANHLVRDAK
jgi:hypothetical protein